MPETYIILGNSRSCTSITAGILSIFGISMDADIMAPDRFAPKGYYESNSAKEISYKIFELARPDFEYPENQHIWHHPPYTEILAKVGMLDKEVDSFVKMRSSEKKWGFKSPITAFTLDHFLPHIENPRIIATVRNPLENAKVASSIYKIDFLTALKTVNYCNYLVAKQLEEKKLDHFFVNFEDYKLDPVRVAEELASFCDVTLTAEMKKEVRKFVIKGQFGVHKYSSRVARRKMEIKSFARKIFSPD